MIRDVSYNWHKAGESYVVEDIYKEAICTELYQKGLREVPNVFFGFDYLYGDKLNEQQTVIQIETHKKINGALKNGIRECPEFKARLTEITWNELMKFKNITAAFVKRVENRELSHQQLKEALDGHVRVIALAEYNGMLPVSWYNDMLKSIFKGQYHLTAWEFSFSHIQPYRITIYLAKLRILKPYLLGRTKEYHNQISSYLKHFSQLDYHYPEFPLNIDDAEEEEKLRDEIVKMAKFTDVKKIDLEIDGIQQKRANSRRRYYYNLSMVGQHMRDAGYSCREINNIVSALTIVSLAATEEEYRHILQNRFWRALSVVFRSLHMPINTTCSDDLILALQQQGSLRC